MPNTQIEWEKTTLSKFNTMIERLPLFHRTIAREVVNKKAILNAQSRSSKLVEEVDVVQAFLSEVPKAFYSMMIKLMNDVGLDYKKYEKS